MKGSKKIHVAVTSRSLPIVTGLGPRNEHESRKLIPLLNEIQIRNIMEDPRADQKNVSGLMMLRTIHFF